MIWLQHLCTTRASMRSCCNLSFFAIYRINELPARSACCSPHQQVAVQQDACGGRAFILILISNFLGSELPEQDIIANRVPCQIGRGVNEYALLCKQRIQEAKCNGHAAGFAASRTPVISIIKFWWHSVCMDQGPQQEPSRPSSEMIQSPSCAWPF